MNQPTLLIWNSMGKSHVGNVRQINEDACLDLPEIGLWVVADGMGGHESGDTASRMIVEDLQQIEPPTSLDEFIDRVRDGLQSVNRKLREESARRGNKTIGSTVVALIAFGHRCACVWAGDSRIYLLRDGALARLTRDHSEVEELVEMGILRPEDAESSPHANIITRAVGGDDTLDLDTREGELRHGDTYVLCSDGLYKELSEDEIERLSAEGDSESVANRLLNLALSRGARDNVTVLVVQITDPFAGATDITD